MARAPFAYEKRPLMPALAAGLLSAALALAVSILLNFWIIPPIGWSNDAPFRADGLWLVEAFVSRCQGYLDEGFSIQLAVRHGLALVQFDFDLHFDILDQLEQRIETIALSCVLAGPVTAGLVAWETRRIDIRIHWKGRRFLIGRAGIAAATASLADEIGQYGSGILLAPGIVLSKMRELRNVLIVGAPNSGKTRIVLFLIGQILDRFRLEPKTTRVLIHDTTGEIYRGLPLLADEFAVIGLRRKKGWAWAMGRDIRSLADATTLAQHLIRPHNASSGENRVFDAGAVVCMTGCLALARSRHQGDWGPAELFAIVLENPVALREAFARVYPAAATLLIIEPDTGALNRTSASFILSFQAHVVSMLETLANAWAKIPSERRFSFVDWLDGVGQQPGVVILQRSARHGPLSSMWMGAVLDLIAAHGCDETYNQDRRMRVHLVLDEFYQLGDLHGPFQQVLDVGRNKNIAVIAAFQDLNQGRIAGGEDRARAFRARFATKIIGQMPEGPEAVEAAELIGERVVLTAPAKPGEAPPEKTVAIVDPDIIAADFGIVHDDVRAAVVGLGDVVEVCWPITVWKPIR